MTTAIQIYERMVAAIDQAADDEHIYQVPQAAEREGMNGGEIRRDLSQRWKYSFTDDAGENVELECYWYDQSKAFSIRPDMHVMTVRFESPTDSLTHSRRYES